MKKFIIAVGLLLFAAVFMSGCVTETEDPIVGTWNNHAPDIYIDGAVFGPTTMVFNADGTGFTLNSFSGELAHADIPFSITCAECNTTFTARPNPCVVKWD